MYEIAIVDDDVVFQEYSLSILDKILFQTNIEYRYLKYKTSEDFLNDFMNHHFSILILDIELPGLNGVELAQIIRKMEQNISIVFLTSYENYMYDAFGFNVHKYILKNEIKKKLPNTILEVLETLNKRKSKILFLKCSFGEISVPHDQIVCIMYINRKMVVYTKDNNYITNEKTIKNMMAKLDTVLFAQPNSGTIVNIQYIKSISQSEIILKNFDSSITISRGRYKEIRNQYINYLMSGESL